MLPVDGGVGKLRGFAAPQMLPFEEYNDYQQYPKFDKRSEACPSKFKRDAQRPNGQFKSPDPKLSYASNKKVEGLEYNAPHICRH